MAIDPTGCDSIYIYEKDKFKAISYKNDENRYLVKGKVEKSVISAEKGIGQMPDLANGKDVAILPTNEEFRTIIETIDEANRKGVEVGGHKVRGADNVVRWDDGTQPELRGHGQSEYMVRSINLFQKDNERTSDPVCWMKFYWHVHPMDKYNIYAGYDSPSTGDKEKDNEARKYGYSGTTMVIGGRTNHMSFY